MRLNGIMMLEAIPRHLELSLEIFFVNGVAGGAERKATTGVLLKVGLQRKPRTAERMSGNKGWKCLWQAQASHRTLRWSAGPPSPQQIGKRSGMEQNKENKVAAE